MTLEDVLRELIQCLDEAKRHLEQRIYDVQTELRQGPLQREAFVHG